MKPSTIQDIRGENAKTLTELVRKSPELIPLCRDFAEHVWEFEYNAAKKYVSTGTKEEGLDYLREHPQSIVSIARNMTPQAFVGFTKALQEIMPQLYLTTYNSTASLPVDVHVHPKPHILQVGIPNGIRYRLWSKKPEISWNGGHPDWNDFGILDAHDSYDYYRDESDNLRRRLRSKFDPLQELHLRLVSQSLGGEHAIGGTKIYEVRK